jgi:SAM-dependent methyltransferase
MSATANPKTNEAERQRWNDERWAAIWPKRERLTDAVTMFVLEAASLQAGERVLDVGCGGGKTSLAAAGMVGGAGAVVGADLSTPLTALAVERAREAGVSNATFTVLDMQTDQVEGRPFDVALSQFGVMFFDEPVRAFGNIRAHLKPGGRLAFACWQAADENPWFFAPALAEFLPPPAAPPPGKSLTGPFALADPEQTSAVLRSAGFRDPRSTPHRIVVEAPHDAVVDDVQFELLGLPADRIPTAQAAVADHMRQFMLDAERSRFPLAFQIFEATSPGPA